MDSPMYVYELPYSRLLELQKILDIEGKWKELGAQMDIPNDDMAWIGMAFKRGSSPTEELLNKYCHSNPTVCELFRHLRRIKAERAMNALQGFVPDRLFREETRSRMMLSEKQQAYQEQSLGSDISGLPQPTPPSNLSHHMHIASSETPLPPYQYPYKNGGDSMISKPYMPMESPSVGTVSSNMGTVSNLSGGAVCSANMRDPSLHTWQSRPREPVESTCDATTTQNLMSPYSGHPASSQRQALQAVENTTPQRGSKDRIGGSLKPIQDETGTLDAALTFIQPYDLYELKEATDDFSPNKVLGQGGFGVVYKGRIGRLNMDVAIKKLRKPEDYQEIKALFVYRHENIIPLIGYCKEGQNMILIYRYMEQGSLEQRLLCKNNTPPLTWVQRLNILSGTAKAVHYLHNGRQDETMIHGDIKSANILIDKHFEAKIADFGLAKYATAGSTPSRHTHVTQYSPSVYGSRAYLPKEYLQDPRHLNVKTDTFSFGVVIFETCMGVQAGAAETVSQGKYKFLKDVMDVYRDLGDNSVLTKLRDPKCPQWPDNQWHGALDLGFECTKESRKKRPEMKEVANRLDILLNLARKIVAAEISKRKSAPGQSMSASEKSVNLSFESQGEGRSVHAGNRPQGGKTISDDIEKEFSKMNIGSSGLKQMPVSSQPSLKGQAFPNKLGLEEDDYLNPPGGDGDDDYIHPGTAHRREECSMQGKLIGMDGNCSNAAQSISPYKTEGHDADDLPYDARKLADPEFTVDCSVKQRPVLQGSVSGEYKTAELDPDDPKWLECDPKKQAALEQVDLPVQALEPITPDSEEVKNYMINHEEAWMVQDYYDKKRHSQEEEESAFDVCAPEDSVCLSEGSSEGSMNRPEVVPNEYITMAESRKSKCPQPPPTPPTSDLSSSSWYGSLQSKEPPPAHTKKMHQIPLHNSTGSANSSYGNAPQPIAVGSAPKSFFLASHSDKEEGISVRGRPSDLPSSSSQTGNSGGRHLSHNPEKGGLWVPESQGDSENSSVNQTEESSEQINAKKNKFKKLPIFQNWLSTREPEEGSDGCV